MSQVQIIYLTYEMFWFSCALDFAFAQPQRNFQHPAQFTEEGLRRLFIEHLDKELPVEEIWRRVAWETTGNKLVLKKDNERKRY